MTPLRGLRTAAAVIRALNSYDRDEGGERKIPGVLNQLPEHYPHATLSVLKTRAAREVDPRDAAALDAWFETISSDKWDRRAKCCSIH